MKVLHITTWTGGCVKPVLTNSKMFNFKFLGLSTRVSGSLTESLLEVSYSKFGSRHRLQRLALGNFSKSSWRIRILLGTWHQEPRVHQRRSHLVAIHTPCTRCVLWIHIQHKKKSKKARNFSTFSFLKMFDTDKSFPQKRHHLLHCKDTIPRIAFVRANERMETWKTVSMLKHSMFLRVWFFCTFVHN